MFKAIREGVYIGVKVGVIAFVARGTYRMMRDVEKMLNEVFVDATEYYKIKSEEKEHGDDDAE